MARKDANGNVGLGQNGHEGWRRRRNAGQGEAEGQRAGHAHPKQGPRERRPPRAVQREQGRRRGFDSEDLPVVRFDNRRVNKIGRVEAIRYNPDGGPGGPGEETGAVEAGVGDDGAQEPGEHAIEGHLGHIEHVRARASVREPVSREGHRRPVFGETGVDEEHNCFEARAQLLWLKSYVYLVYQWKTARDIHEAT